MRPSKALATCREQVLSIAAAHGVSSVRVFGSVVKGSDADGSDLDLLVDVPPGASLFDLARLQMEIETLLGIKVDLRTEGELHSRIRPRVLAEARLV